MIPRTAIKPGTRVRFTKTWKIYLVTTVPAGTTGTITSDHCANEEPYFRVLPDDQDVRDDLEDCGGELHMLDGWEDYLELDEPSALPPR
jgi:hypothetical protein